MFKKSLAAVAVLGALASSSFAADVTFYGVVDYGFQFRNQEVTQFTNDVSKHATNVEEFENFTMDSGINAASRFGIKGTEDLGNGYKVSFKLENSFAADDGTLDDGLLFKREASLTLAGDFGQISAGRMGGVGSAAGSYDLVYAIGDAFDGGSGDVLGLVTSSRYNNMITYQSPKVAGLQATVQYSFQADGVGEEGHKTANRYASGAVTGEFGALQMVAAYEQILAGAKTGNADTKVFYLGGNYDLGVAKVFALAQYFEGAREMNGFDFADAGFYRTTAKTFVNGAEGYGLHLGTAFDLAGGATTLGLYYVDGEQDMANDDGSKLYTQDAEYMGFAAGYNYPLSARTELYFGAGYGKIVLDQNAWDQRDFEIENKHAFVGLTHNF